MNEYYRKGIIRRNNRKLSRTTRKAFYYAHFRRWDGMTDEKQTDVQALATYLLALSIMEKTNNTYVTREIRQALAEVKKELGL